MSFSEQCAHLDDQDLVDKLMEWLESDSCPSNFDDGFILDQVKNLHIHDRLLEGQRTALENIAVRFRVDLQ